MNLNMALVPLAQAASSETRHPDPFSYHVFLSFRGEDTRKTFTDHLYKAFVNAGFRTFRDDDQLERGEDIKPGFLKAIQESRSSIIVFSKGYASSRWCLDELVMLLQRKRTSDHVVLPVFYDVDPSDVRKQRGTVADAFASLENKQSVKHKVEGWRKALGEVADLAGMVLQNQSDGHESKFIEKIVKVIEDKLRRGTSLSVAPHLIDVHSRAQNINSWLQDRSTQVAILVLYGMRGVGKTTIAKFVYNLNFERFQGSSFLENIRESSRTTNDLIQMQKKLLYDVLNMRKVKIYTISEGIKKIEDAISSKRVFLVFDDVDHVNQLDAVFRMQGELYPGSKVIITTNNARLSNACHRLADVHYIDTFGYNESLKLFSWYAFGKDSPNEGYMEYSKSVVHLCGGLPLALKVLGSSLSGKSMVVWESALKKLQVIPNGELMNTLSISYDSLQDGHDQNLFLHIACFFIGMEKDDIVRILDSCGFYTVVGIQNLIERCLVTIGEDNKVHMHHMIRDMGRGIVLLESKEPEERSRLWHHNDSFKVLTTKNGTQTIEGLIMNMEMVQMDLAYTHPRNSHEVIFEIDVFERMHKLRLLMLSHVQFNGSYGEFPAKLRWLCWNKFSFDSLPNDFPLESLVVLELCYSNLKQVWRETKCLLSLKTLNLSHSHDLTETPDFSYIPNLESLILKDCVNLVHVHESIGNLERLVHLNIEDCNNIRKLPKNMKSLRTFQADGIPIYRLFMDIGEVALSKNPKIDWASCLPQSLVNLSLVNCNLSDDNFPKDLALSALQRVNLSSNAITCLPEFIRGVTRLQALLFRDCTELKSLVGIPSTRDLDVTRSTLLEKVTGPLNAWKKGGLGAISWNSNCNLVEVETWFKLEPIESVEVEITQLFGSINFQPTDTIMIGTGDGEVLWKRRRLPIQVLHELGMISTFLPGNDVPSQFSYKSSRGSSISFTVASLPNQRIRGLNVFSVYAQSNIDCRSSIDDMKDTFPQPIMATVSNKSKSLKWWYGPLFFGLPGNGQDMIWLSHWNNYMNQLVAGDEVTVSVFTRSELQVKECGIQLLYEQDDQQNNITYIPSYNYWGISSELFQVYYICWSTLALIDRDFGKTIWFKYLLKYSDDITDKEEGQQGDGTIETRIDEKTFEASWTKDVSAKAKNSLANIEHKKNKEVSSPTRELGSIEDCMEVLEAMEGLDDAAYFRACENFTNSNWCRMFMMMSDVRKRVWLNVDQHKKNKEVSSPLRELGSIEDCMDVLEAMEGADDAAYFRACEKFTNSNWRRMFMKMSNARKIAWLKSLI